MARREREIVRPARAGSAESNDLLVILSPADTLDIQISSEVFKQYGDQIEKLVRDTLEEQGVKKGLVKIEDKGALDFTIKARIEAAVNRGSIENV